jgi:hypothetical protein
MIHASPLTLTQLERHLYAATDILRSKVDVTAYQEYFFGLLFLKRCSDLFEEQREARAYDERDATGRAGSADALNVPPEARWAFLCSRAADEGNAGRLDQALAALARENASLQGALGHLSFSYRPGRARLTEQTLRDLLRHFSRYRLRDADLEGQSAEAARGEEDEEEAEQQAQLVPAQDLKTALAAHRRARRSLQRELLTRLEAARSALSEPTCRQTVLDLLLHDLLARLEHRSADQRRKLLAALEHLWDKYRVSLREIEADLKHAEQRTDALMKTLGYSDG